jgi:putative PIN family toxin of toxin-antitoxin system
MIEVIIDTNVFVSAMRSSGGASRQVLRGVLNRKYRPLFGNALWNEYEDLLRRDVWTLETTEAQRRDVMAALASVSRWVTVYYGWRPNLSDEGDNHLIELAVAGNAQALVTHNVRDFVRSELKWPSIEILTPSQFLEQMQ